MHSGPVALVTGASRGIGRTIATSLAAGGYAVVVNYARNREAAESAVAAIEAAGGTATALAGDVGVSADRQRLVDQVLERWDRIDVLVNNAGITSVGRRDLLEATEEGWEQVFATNLKGPFFLSQRVAREMIARPPHLPEENASTGAETGRRAIINISSISADAVSTNRGDYCLTKAALRMMTWLFATRLADDGIGVFEICPGVIASDMTAPVQAKYDELIAAGLSPIRRWGQPEDVSRAVMAIVGGAFPFSTGECFHVDGGFHIRRL